MHLSGKCRPRLPAYLSELRQFVRLMPLLAAAAAYVMLAPNIDFAPDLTWHDGQRLAQLALLMLVGCAVLLPATGRPVWETWALLPRWSRLVLGMVLILGLVSGIVAPLPRWALLEWSSLVLLGMLVFAVAASWRVSSPMRDQILVGVFFATGLAYGVKAVTMYVAMLAVGPEYGLGFKTEELFTGFSNVRFFSHVQTMLLPFLVLPALWWGRTPLRCTLLFSIPVAWWMLAIASGTRGSWVALLIGALLAWWFGGKSGSRWMRWQTGALLGGAATYLLFVILVPDWLARPASFMHRVDDIISLRGRDVLWELSADLIAQHPWLGIGPMHFAKHLSVLAAHPHNAILQFMAEWGVPAALGITVVWTAGGLAFGLHVRRMASVVEPDRHSMVLVALLAAITGASAQAMVDGILVMPVSQILLALLSGWALGTYFSARAATPASGHRSGLAFRGTVLVAAVILTWSVLPELGRLEERMQAHLRLQPEGPNPKLLPRFWIQGWID